MMHKSVAIRRYALLCLCASLSFLLGCSALPEKTANETPAQHPVHSIVRDEITYPIDV